MGGKTETSWQPGQSGNPNGRPKKEKTFSALLRKYGDEEITVRINGKKQKVRRIDALSYALWQHAISVTKDGNIKINEIFYKHLLNRYEGLPTHRIAGEEDAPPIPLVIRRRNDNDS